MNTVEAAQAPDTFDVLSFIQETAYPTMEVTVFQDAASATEYVRLVTQRTEKEAAGAKSDSDEISELTAKIEEVGEKLRKSALTFTLQGLAPGVVRDLMDVSANGEVDEDESPETINRDNVLIAKTIKSVTNHEGAKDERVWDESMVASLRKFMKEGEFGKLVEGVTDINFNAIVFDQATDAGFSR